MASHLEFAMDSTPAFRAAVRESLYRNGCVVLRDAIPRSMVDRYHELAQHAYHVVQQACLVAGFDYRAMPHPQTVASGWPTVAWNLQIGQLIPNYFSAAASGHSMFDLVAGADFDALRFEIFKGASEISISAHARRVSPRLLGQTLEQCIGFQPPIHFHIDAQYHASDRFGLNFWTPLIDCGADAPGLQALCLGHEQSAEIAGFDPVRRSFDAAKLAALNTASNLDQHGETFVPNFCRGDIMLITNWTIHSTSHRPGMTRDRHSFELRYECDRVAFPT
jgi:hypothetical protein